MRGPTQVDAVSPLQAIKQRESALRQRIREARRQAEARIDMARTDAEQIIARADLSGRTEAEACYKGGIEQARRDAEAMVAAAHQDAVALRRRALAKLDGVAAQIESLVLPGETILEEMAPELAE